MEKRYVIKGYLTATPVDIDKKTGLNMNTLRKLLKNVPVDAEVVSVGLSPEDGLTLEYRQVVDITKDENLVLTRDYSSSPINWATRSMNEEVNSIRAEASESM